MKQSIWKFPISIEGEQEVKMPKGAQILCVQTLGDTACLWAVVDESAPAETRTIEVFGTGHPMPRTESRVYIGTFQLTPLRSPITLYVFHVFEKLI